MIEHWHKLESKFTLLIYDISVCLKLKFHGNTHTGTGIFLVGKNQNRGAAVSFMKCESECCVLAFPFTGLAGGSTLEPH